MPVFTLSGLSGENTKEPLSRGEGLWIRACDELQSNSFTLHLHKKWKKKTKKKENVGSSTQHSKVDLISHSPVPLIEEIFFAFAGEWSGHVCQWQGSLFSLTLITSFTNLQIYYSTVCVKESMPSPAAWSLDLWWQQDQWSYSVEISQFRIWAVWK